MRKLKTLVTLLVVSSSMLLTGCFEEQDNRYSGPTQVEWAPPLTRTITAALLNANDDGNGNVNVTVVSQLIGAHRGSALTVNAGVWTDNDAPTLTTTAVEGTDYNAVPANFQIPANSSFGDYVVSLKRYNGVAGGTTRRIRVEILPGTGYKVATNYRFAMITIASNPAP